ncbi:MAG: TldD/PmbA family protein [Actinomycetota bacterium]
MHKRTITVVAPAHQSGPPEGDTILGGMIDDRVIAKVLNEALSRGGDGADLFVEKRVSNSFRLEDSKIEDVASGSDAGGGIRVIAGDRASYAYTNVLTSEALVDAARAARAGLSEGPVKPRDLRRAVAPVVHAVSIPPHSVEAGRKVEALRAADDAARSEGAGVRQVIASYADVNQKILIASSDGRVVGDERTRVRFAVQVIAARDGIIATGFEAPGHSGGFELLDRHPAARLGEAAAGKALRMLDAKPSPAGEYPVVLAPGTGGVLIHEACGHGLEADTLVKQASVYASRNGERFGSNDVTIVDDGTVAGAWGSLGVDDEGTAAQRTVLFQDGVLVGHLSDKSSARRIEHPPTGNGRRQSYAHLPIVRMTNTDMEPGTEDPAEIIRSIDRGVYAANFAGGEVNPATGNFVFGMSEAYMILNGEIAHPIRGANLIGNGPQVLGSIDAIGGDFERWEGVCGKDGQAAPVTTGMATVLLGRMTVGGTQA